MIMVTIHTRIPAVTNLNNVVSICSVVSITVGLKQTWFNITGYPLRYQYVNRTAPKTRWHVLCKIWKRRKITHKNMSKSKEKHRRGTRERKINVSVKNNQSRRLGSSFASSIIFSLLLWKQHNPSKSIIHIQLRPHSTKFLETTNLTTIQFSTNSTRSFSNEQYHQSHQDNKSPPHTHTPPHIQ
jgi:hypothetical protein